LLSWIRVHGISGLIVNGHDEVGSFQQVGKVSPFQLILGLIFLMSSVSVMIFLLNVFLKQFIE